MSNKIILYPSNWLYNAGVVGFLRVLEKVKTKPVFKEGTVELDISNLVVDDIFDKWDELTYEKLRISYKGKKGGTKKYYYANQTEKSIKSKISSFFKKDMNNKAKRKSKLSCTLCGQYENTTLSKMERLNQTFGNILFGSEKSFPNTYWMFKSREFVCSKCEFILMCHHLSLVPLQGEDIKKEALFVNTPLFNLTIDLNEFVQKIIDGRRKYPIIKLLGSSFLQWAIKRRALLGAWTMMNVEVVIKKRIQTAPNKFEDIIDYFDLPYHITRVLLDYEVASLIKRINEEKIFDLIVKGKFSELEKANYFVLRGLLKLKNNQNILDNDPLRKYISNIKQDNLNEVAKLLPELYAEIMRILGKQ